MSGFQFPPPPPPPPTNTSQSQVSQNHPAGGDGERRGRGRGRGPHRGGRGRGNGLDHIRSEAFASIRNGDHSANGQQGLPSTNATSQYNQVASNSYSTGMNQQYGVYGQTYQQNQAQPAYLPTGIPLPGTYVNPAFQGTPSYMPNSGNQPATNYSLPPNNYPTYPQNQGTYHQGNYSSANQPMNNQQFGHHNHTPIRGGRGSSQRGVSAHRGSSSSGPPRNSDGHKRKLDALRGPQPRKFQKTGPPAAPSIPGFGTPVLPSKPETPQTLSKLGQHAQKPMMQKKTLGLTPGDADPIYSSSESDNDEDDMDEEKLYKTLGEGLTFEHNGSILSLNNVADLMEWINERKENFPTRARIPEKEEKKRRVGAERMRLLAGARVALYDRFGRRKGVNEKPTKRPQRRESALEKERREIADLRSQLSQKERRLSQLEARVGEPQNDEPSISDAMTAPIDLPTPMDQSSYLTNTHINGHAKDETKIADSNSVVDDKACVDVKTVTSSLLVSADESSSSDSSDDEPPESMTAKPPPLASTKRKLCKFYSSTGRCRDGDACRFRHVLKPEAVEALKKDAEAKEARRRDPYAPMLDAPDKGPRLTIHQRLLEQEQDQEEKLALQVIKHLGKMGLFAEKDVSA